MPRGPAINKSVERIIRTVKKDHPDMTAKEIRGEVRSQIPNAKLYPENWPSDDSIQKLLKKDREERIKAGPDPKDKLWALIYANVYPIPAEALPIVLKVWAKALEFNRPLTIREALWAAKLYPFFKNKDGSSDTYNIFQLLFCAKNYATFESIEALEKGGSLNSREELLSYWLDDSLLLKEIAHLPVFKAMSAEFQVGFEKWADEHPETIKEWEAAAKQTRKEMKELLKDAQQ